MRNAIVGLMLSATISACASSGAAGRHRMGAAGPAPAPWLSLQDVNGATPGTTGIANVTSVNGTLFYSPPNGTYVSLSGGGGGGGSGTVHTDGVTITGDGSVGTPVAGLASSASNAGTMSAANFTKVANALDYDGWCGAQVALMIANGATLGNYRCRDMDLVPQGTTMANALSAVVAVGDGQQNGGALVNGNAATANPLTRTVWNTPKTSGFSMCYQGIFAAAQTYGTSGYSNLTNSHSVDMGSINAASATNFTMRLAGAGNTDLASGVAIDGNPHTLCGIFDKTTVKFYVDGVQRATTATLTNLVDEAVGLYFFSSGTMKVMRFAYGY